MGNLHASFSHQLRAILVGEVRSVQRLDFATAIVRTTGKPLLFFAAKLSFAISAAITYVNAQVRVVGICFVNTYDQMDDPPKSPDVEYSQRWYFVRGYSCNGVTFEKFVPKPNDMKKE